MNTTTISNAINTALSDHQGCGVAGVGGGGGGGFMIKRIFQDLGTAQPRNATTISSDSERKPRILTWKQNFTR